MGPVLTVLTIAAAVGAGVLLSRVPGLGRLSSSRALAAARMALLCPMVGAMGFRIGRTPQVIQAAGTLGLASLLFAAATMAGTLAVLAAVFAARVRGRRGAGGAGPAAATAAAKGSTGAWRDAALLLGMLLAGFLVGRMVPIFPGANGEKLVTALLYALLVAIGFGLGGSDLPRLHLLVHPDLLVIPLGTAVGSLLGGLGAGLLLGMRPGGSLAVAAGFGWYSLSGVVLTRLDSPTLGTVAFLSNMIRESLALLLIPLLGRSRFPLLAVGAGGATSMDVTLPLIGKSCGAPSVPFAVASGALLSLSVPFLVPLLYALR